MTIQTLNSLNTQWKHLTVLVNLKCANTVFTIGRNDLSEYCPKYGVRSIIFFVATAGSRSSLSGQSTPFQVFFDIALYDRQGGGVCSGVAVTTKLTKSNIWRCNLSENRPHNICPTFHCPLDSQKIMFYQRTKIVLSITNMIPNTWTTISC